MEDTNKSKKALVIISKVFYVLSYIAMIACFVAAGVCFLGMVIAPFMPYSGIADFVNSHPETFTNTDFLKYVNITYAEVGCVIGLLSGGLAGVTCLWARNLFGSIKEANTPFTDKAVHNLNLIGIFALIQAIALPATLGIIIAATKTGDAYKAFEGGSFLLALFVFAMSLVFKYGVSLQKQADTTL